MPDEIDTLKAINQDDVRTVPTVWVSPVGSEAAVQVALYRRADVGRIHPLIDSWSHHSRSARDERPVEVVELPSLHQYANGGSGREATLLHADLLGGS